MKRLTIALVLKKFEPTTGKSKHVLEVSRRLVEAGHTVHVITNAVKWNGPTEVLAHLQIHVLGGSQNSLYMKPRKIAAMADAMHADLLELHGGLSMTLFARSFARASHIPVVVNIHSQPTDFFREWRYLSISDWWHDHKYIADIDDVIGLGMNLVGLQRFVRHPMIRAVIVPSRQLEKKMHGIADVRYLPSGANVRDGLSPAADDAASQTVLFFGRSVMVRGIDTLITAFERIAPQHPALKLALLLLPDIDLERVQKLVQRSPVRDRIELAVGRQEYMDQRLAQATIGVFPFRTSGCIPEQPLTLIEAMGTGVPCITTPIGTIPEIVTDGHSGLLVRPNDATALAGAMERLLSDTALRTRIRQAGQEAIRANFQWGIITQKTEELYHHVAGS